MMELLDGLNKVAWCILFIAGVAELIREGRRWKR